MKDINLKYNKFSILVGQYYQYTEGLVDQCRYVFKEPFEGHELKILIEKFITSIFAHKEFLYNLLTNVNFLKAQSSISYLVSTYFINKLYNKQSIEKEYTYLLGKCVNYEINKMKSIEEKEKFLGYNLNHYLLNRISNRNAIIDYYKNSFKDILSDIALNNKVYVFHQKELANQSSFEVKEETTQGNEDPFFTQYMLNFDSSLLKAYLTTYKENQNMVDYINKHINLCNRYGSPKMFSGTVFLDSISESVEYPMELLRKYRDNYVALTRIINNFLTILIDTLSLIPLQLRYMCKIIYDIAKKKFPNALQIDINCFIWKFFFGEIFEYIILHPTLFRLIKGDKFNKGTKINVSIVCKIFMKLTKGELFDNNNNKELTLFNWFFLETMPQVFLFYEKLVDIELPSYYQNIYNSEQWIDIDDNNEDHVNDTTFCISMEQIICLAQTISDNMTTLKTIKNSDNIFYFYEQIEKKGTIEQIIQRKAKDEETKTKIFYYFGNISVKDKESTRTAENTFDNSTQLMLSIIKNSIVQFLLRIGINNQKIYTTKELFTEMYNRSKEVVELTEIFEGGYSKYNRIKNINNTSLQEYLKDDCIALYNDIIEDIKDTIYKCDIVLMNDVKGKVTKVRNILSSEKVKLMMLKESSHYLKAVHYLNTISVKVSLESNKNFLFSTQLFDILKKEDYSKLKFKCSNKPCKKKKRITLDEFISLFPSYNTKFIKNNEIQIKQKEFHIELIFNKFLAAFKEAMLSVNSFDFKSFGEYSIYSDIKDSDYVNKLSDQTKIEKGISVLYSITKKILFESIYEKLFPIEQTDNDLEIYNKCNILRNCEIENIFSDKLDLGEIENECMKSLLQMDNEYSPFEKILLFVKVKEILINYLFNYYSKEISKEETFIVLLYIIIKAKPKRLDSTINYLNLFLFEERILYITDLNCLAKISYLLRKKESKELQDIEYLKSFFRKEQ